MSAIAIEPIRDDLAFGARVRGLTRADLAEDATRRRIADAFEERGLLVFEDVEQTGEMQVAISEVFGPLKDHPSAAVSRPEGGAVGVIEINHDPNAAGRVRVGDRVLSQWRPWHFDHCYNDQLNRAGVLRCTVVPDEGGETRFVDGIALHDRLSPELRAELADAEVLYRMDVILGNLRYGRPDDFEVIDEIETARKVMAEYEGRPGAIHPAIWERSTGEKVFHVSPWMAQTIVDRDDGVELLERTCDELVALADEAMYSHSWSVGDMVIWDNWRVLHSVSGIRPELHRTMQRTTIEGDYGLGRFEGQPAPA